MKWLKMEEEISDEEYFEDLFTQIKLTMNLDKFILTYYI